MKFQIPVDDRWFFERLAVQIQRLILRQSVDEDMRPGLMRVLFAIQRLPNLADSTNISLCICDPEDAVFMSGHYALSISSDGLHVTHYTEDGHADFRLNFFQRSNDCFDELTPLTGESRRLALLGHLESLDLQSSDGVVMLEDYSSGPEVDTPPLLMKRK